MSWRDFEFFAPCEAGPIAIAHRGGMGEREENSLEAFRRATSAGLRFIEIDLRATAVGELLVWHGRGAERARPDLPLDIGKLDEGQVVLFENVLEELPDDTRFFVDLKNKLAGEALARIVHRTGTARRICVGSFSHARTTAAAAAIARTTGYTPCTAMTPRQVARLLVQSMHPTASWRSPSVSAQIPVWMATGRVIQVAHTCGALVFAWTVNDEPMMHKLLDRGVDGLMTDFPTVLAQLVSDRGSSRERGRTSASGFAVGR